MSSRAVLVVVVALAGCADVERGPRPPVPDAAPDVAPPEAGSAAGDSGRSFAGVWPLIDGGCKRCHMPGGMAATSSFLLTGQAATDYPLVRALVEPSAPAGSRLLAKATGQGHGGGVIYAMSSNEYAALLAWIQSGAAP
jgi:hypothetical protein